MAGPAEVIEFDGDDPSEIVARLDGIARARGWVNLEPAVDPEERPPPAGLLSLFAAPRPDAPQATWVPSKEAGGEEGVDQVGITHTARRKALPALSEAGITVPDGWGVVADHARLGLVLAVPAERRSEAVPWLVRAATALCPLPFGGRWYAAIYEEKGARS